MNATKKTGRRIVSRGEYVDMQMSKMGKRLSSAYLFGLSLLAASLALWGMFRKDAAIGIPIGCYLFAVAAATYCGGRFYMKQARAMEPVVLLTHANAADLPAPDSLMRASEKPLLEEQTELLRAVTQGPQTPAEQLVRPVE